MGRLQGAGDGGIYVAGGQGTEGIDLSQRRFPASRDASEASILDYLFTDGVSGASVFKGVAGFGADHHVHSVSFVELSDHLPVKVEFVETKEKVDELLAKLTELAGTG